MSRCDCGECEDCLRHIIEYLRACHETLVANLATVTAERDAEIAERDAAMGLLATVTKERDEALSEAGDWAARAATARSEGWRAGVDAVVEWLDDRRAITNADADAIGRLTETKGKEP